MEYIYDNDMTMTIKFKIVSSIHLSPNSFFPFHHHDVRLGTPSAICLPISVRASPWFCGTWRVAQFVGAWNIFPGVSSMDSEFQPINLQNLKSDGDLFEIDRSIGVRSDIDLLPTFLLCYLDTVKEKKL